MFHRHLRMTKTNFLKICMVLLQYSTPIVIYSNGLALQHSNNNWAQTAESNSLWDSRKFVTW